MQRGFATVRVIAWSTLLLSGCSAARNIVNKSSPLTPPRGTTINWSFDDAIVGAHPEAWERAETKGRGQPGEWAVRTDENAASKPHVLDLETSNTGDTFNLCVLRQPNAADVDVSVRVRADTGREDQGGGIVWRFRDQKNYYVARWNPLEANYALYKVVGGKRTLLTEVSAENTIEAWMTLRVVSVGDGIDCYFNHQRKIAVQDASLTGAGRVGLWTKADASSAFDDFTLTPGR